MAAPVFPGVGVALVTLFDEQGELDAPASAALAAQLVDLGVRAVVVAGTTGEAGAPDTAGRIVRVEAVRRAGPPAKPPGASALLSFGGPLGGAGPILPLANADPERCVSAFGGDIVAQGALVQPHLAAHEGFPRGLKEMVAARFGTSTACRVA